MLHEHMYISAFSTDPFYLNARQLPLTFPRLYFAAGATTIRTAGSLEPYSDLRIKKDIDLGLQPGPSIELTAPYVEGKNALFPQMKENQTPAEAAAFVNYWADQGFTSFKAYVGIDKPTLKAAIDAVQPAPVLAPAPAGKKKKKAKPAPPPTLTAATVADKKSFAAIQALVWPSVAPDDSTLISQFEAAAIELYKSEKKQKGASSYKNRARRLATAHVPDWSSP